jgi:P-type E1-E2 ATPase
MSHGAVPWLEFSGKPEAKAAVAALRGLGVEVVMSTGDNPRTTEAVAREAGIENVAAGLSPEGKAAGEPSRTLAGSR